MKFTVYYIRKYDIEISDFDTEMIEELLLRMETLIKSTDNTFSHCKWVDDEIGMYLIEIFLSDFTFKQARFFLKIADLAIEKDTALIALADSNSRKQNILERIDHDNDHRLYLNSYVTFSYNPLKLTVLIICFLKRLQDIHDTLNFDPTIERY